MLEPIELAHTGRTTTRLGFGCSGLMGGISERESLRLLHTAYDAGIRHFDVAPSYGHGLAERCLGKFLRGKADRVTVATKYGVLPPPHTILMGAASRLLRPAVRRFPTLRKSAAKAAAGLKSNALFSSNEAERSLETSLRELGIDRVDLWLLHEATASDLNDSDLLAALENAKRRGRIGNYGVASERGKLQAIWHSHKEYCPVVQCEWSAMDAIAAFPGAFTIHHRAVSGCLAALQHMFANDAILRRRWSDAIDADLNQPEMLAAVMLKAALLANPSAIVLFSSRVSAHILSNVRLAEDPLWNARALRFRELLLGERNKLLPSA